MPPRPPRTNNNNLKRKRTDAKGSKSKSKANSASTKRVRLHVEPPPAKSAKGKGKAPELSTSANGRGGRAAKTQAKAKLNAQAKELEELNRQAAVLARGQSGAIRSSRRHGGDTPVTISIPGRGGASAARPLGTRLSARLRGTEEEEWQAVPDEWLDNGSSSRRAKGKSSKEALPKTGLESDVSSISELTELSEESEVDTDSEHDQDESDEEEQPEEPQQNPEDPLLKDDFVEWETVSTVSSSFHVPNYCCRYVLPYTSGSTSQNAGRKPPITPKRHYTRS